MARRKSEEESSTLSSFPHPIKGILVAAGSVAAFLLWLVILTAIVRWIV